MIRKCLMFVFLFFVLMLVFQFGINFLKTEHMIDYVLVSNEKTFKVKEIYDKGNTFDYYYFDVSYKDIHFLYEIDNLFNKQKMVIKDVNYYELDDDLRCLSLDFINGDESDLLCSKDNQLYSYVALMNDYDFSKMIKSRTLKDKDNVVNSDDLIINTDFLYKDEVLLVYNYKNIMKYAGGTFVDKLTFSANDTYKNNLGVLVGDYYIIPKFTKSLDVHNYFFFNISTNAVFELETPAILSKQLFNLGVYDEKLYVFDKDNKIELEIDPNNRVIKKVASGDDKGIFYRDGKKESITMDELSANLTTFTFENKKYKDVVCDEIFVFDKYAIYVLGNSFYKVYSHDIKKPILLFSMDSFKEVKVKDDRIYFLSGKYLYRFDDNGIYPIVERGEFEFNPSNAYEIFISK